MGPMAPRIPLLSVTLLLAPAATGCADDFAVEAWIDEDMASTIHLAWSTESAGTSWVEYGDSRSRDLVTPQSEASTDHAFTLYGSPFLETVHYRAVTEVDGVELTTTGRIQTGGRPSSLPDLTVNTWDEGAASSERFLLGVASTDGAGCVYVIDREGRWRWYWEGLADHQLVELAWAEAGTFLVNSFHTDHSQDEGHLQKLSFEGEQGTVFTEEAHHAFTRLSDGTIAYIAVDIREWTDPETGTTEDVVGDAIRILPAEDDGYGEPYDLFSTWDWREPEVHDRWDDGFYPQGADWTHANAINHYPDRGTYLISLRNMEMVLEIDDTTGEVVREMGEDAEYTLDADSEPFSYPHEPIWRSSGNLLVVTTEQETVLREYAVDDQEQLVTEVDSFGEGEGLYAVAQGMARELDNGNLLVTWGSAGRLQELTPEGEVVWEVETGAGWILGGVRLFDGFYP